MNDNAHQNIEQQLAMDISEMGLSTRAYNTLWKSGHMTLGAIYNLNPRELFTVKGLGPQTLWEVIWVMRHLGFTEWAERMIRFNGPQPKKSSYIYWRAAKEKEKHPR